MLFGFQELAARHALLEAERGQINSNLVVAADALDPSDRLYRAIQGGHGSYGESHDSFVIAGLLPRYIKRQDVIARGKPEVEQRGTSWSLFGGSLAAFWQERTQWCVRIKYRDGEPALFADTLFSIRKLENAPSLTLPERNLPLPPQELQDVMAKYSDGIVLAVEFERSGESKRTINSRTWRLVPASAICPKSP
ncbi:MAG: hypothetical protein ABI605_15695 [Rhizobacter sp.]